jgi:hypothetical protein
MRKSTTILLLLFCISPFICAQKTRFGQAPPKAKPGTDYPIQAHISGIHVRTDCTVFDPAPRLQDQACHEVAFVDVTLDGKKMELMGNWSWVPGMYQTPITTGDFAARIVKDTPKASTPPMYRDYEVLLADRTAWRCEVRGYYE